MPVYARPAPRQKQLQISPIFICDKVTLHVSREKDKETALGRCRMGRWKRFPSLSRHLGSKAIEDDRGYGHYTIFRPRGRRAAEQRDELASPQGGSINYSVRNNSCAQSEGETVRLGWIIPSLALGQVGPSHPPARPPLGLSRNLETDPAKARCI
jgi:hypothetical protein